MQVYRNLLAIVFLLITTYASAQTGTIRGKIIDEETGEELIGATAQITGTTKGGVTDFTGDYTIQGMAPGTYDLQISFVSYQVKTVSGVEVKAGEVSIINVGLSTDTQQLQEVVVKAEVIRDSEAALVTIKRKSANLLDGISSETFKKIGDSNAGSAIKRVPGVSVQGGKYVFVRGLGDRYTKTILNNMEVPGLDPDRNTIQLDIFPTNVIDNIIVLKSFTADLPADFTGGIVNIETKDFPEEKKISLSASVGFNPDMHFNGDYRAYEGSGTDFLGFDNGDRDLPLSSQANIPIRAGATTEEAAQLTSITRSFNPTFGANTKTSAPNASIGLAIGNQLNFENSSLGYNVALSYRNTTNFFEEAEDNSLYTKSSDFSVTELELDRSRKGSFSSNNVLLGGLVGLAYKTNSSKLKLNFLRIQNGESRSALVDQENFLSNSNRSIREGLAYNERSVTNLLLGGEHYLADSKWTIEWKVAPTFSRIYDKDIRLTPFTVSEEGALSIEPSEGGDPTRLWRFLEEENYSGKLDLTKEFNTGAGSSKLKFGVSNTFKTRDFSVDNFFFEIRNARNIFLGGDPNNLLTPDNVWTDQNDAGTYAVGNFEGSNSYESTINNLGFYVSSELAVTQKLKAIVGLRAELYTQRYTGVDQDFFNSNGAQGRALDDEEVLNSFTPFPTVNLIYNVVENANLRLSYAKTIARPSFKEKSVAQIIDPISNTTWIGNIDLEETDINNFDLRYEYYFKRGQTVAISGFYKTFKNPIEVVVFGENTPSNFTARNNGDAQVFGIELEARKSLDFISSKLSNFSLNFNASVIESQLELDSAEFASRELNLRTDSEGNVIESLDDTREMQGQSPYLVNIGLSYDNFDTGWQGGVYYNVQGSTLSRVGIGPNPDLFTNPFHSVNLSVKKTFGENQKSNIGFRVSNLLDDKQETHFESFGSPDRISTSRSLGRRFTLSFGYTF